MMQTEKKGLSKREKVLIMVMVVFGVTALMIVFVIIPLYNQYNDKTSEYGALQDEKIIIDSKLATEAAIKDEHASIIMRHRADSIRYLNTSLSNEIGRMLTSLCESRGLQPISQQLSVPREFTKVERRPGEQATENGSAFLVVTAVMAVNGEYKDLKNLLDAVEDTEYLRISRVSFSKNMQSLESSLDRISVTFEVTMLKEVALVR